MTLIEMIDRLGPGLGKTTRWTRLQDLKRSGVKVLSATHALEITPAGLVVQTVEGTPSETAAGPVVSGVDSQSYRPMVATLARLAIPFTVVGDANQVATAFEALHSGFDAVRTLKTSSGFA